MTKTPHLLKSIFPGFVWDVRTDKKEIFLTFDDGPIPEVTEFVLNQLDLYTAKATFFCVGENIVKNPSIFQSILRKGHRVGNHTYSHLKGWTTENKAYLADFKACQRVIFEFSNIAETLFRPPYGRVSLRQVNEIRKTHQIIMWSVLSKDYDSSYDADMCLKNTIKATESGSIVLFHDSIKAKKNLQYVLPRFLKHFFELGYVFKAI
jgi:peptidoglycan-N-acetylglucosamine deacetylase